MPSVTVDETKTHIISPMDFEFKVPSTVPQDLLLIQDMIGTFPPLAVAENPVPESPDSSDDSIASTDSEIESEDEVEAGLALHGDDSGMSESSSGSAPLSDSELDASHPAKPEEGREHMTRQRQRPPDDVDEESGVTAATVHLRTKNEIVDTDIMVPTTSEIEPCDTLEKVGAIMSIVEDTVIVRGLPADRVNSLSERALDAASLLVFEDRNVFGYIYETFGPTSQPLYQVKFNEHYPLDTDKVWVSREVFHVPQRSHFVFVDQLKKSRGSDASNLHDEEPIEDEVEFSDDEKEAAFKAQQRKRRRLSVSSSRQSTPASPRIHIDGMVHDTYRGSNPYDAHGPYDDDYQVIGPSRPLPVPYDDPYADVPTPDERVHPKEVNGEFGMPNCESGGAGPKTSRGRISSRGIRGRGVRNHDLRGARRGHRQSHVAFQRTFDSDVGPSLTVAARMIERATGYGQFVDAITPHPPAQPASNAWTSPEINSNQGYGRGFIQPHINPRFAAMLGFNLPSASGSIVPWASETTQDHMFPPQHWAETWPMDGTSAGSESAGNTYRPM